VVDLIRMRAVFFDGAKGEDVRLADIPAELVAEAKAARQKMIESIANVDDAIAEKYLHEQECTPDDLVPAIPPGHRRLQGHAGPHGLGVQEQGRAALARRREDYLPTPSEVENIALDQDLGEAEIKLQSDPAKPFVGLAFKIGGWPLRTAHLYAGVPGQKSARVTSS